MRSESLIETPSEDTNPAVRSVRHVLLVIDQLKTPFGGAERIFKKIATRLPRNRFRVSVLTFASNLTPEEESTFCCPVHVFPLTCAYNLNAARMAVRLLRFIRSEHVDIVHTFFETSDLWAGTIARLGSRCKLISSRRDMGILRSARHKAAYRIVAPLAHKVLAVSEQVRQFVIAEDRLPPKKVITIYNGCDFPDDLLQSFETFRLELRKKCAIPEQAFLVTSVGNVNRVKGFDVLIAAAKTVCARLPQVRFLVVGGIADRKYHNELLEMLDRHGLQDRFQFAGYESSVVPILYASDAFVLPSHSEGFSNALLEAMAAGLPCVATKVGGNVEALEDGQTGFLVEPDSPEAICERICLLCKDPRRASELGIAAKIAAKEKFGLETMVSRIISVYDDLMTPGEARNELSENEMTS